MGGPTVFFATLIGSAAAGPAVLTIIMRLSRAAITTLSRRPAQTIAGRDRAGLKCSTSGMSCGPILALFRVADSVSSDKTADAHSILVHAVYCLSSPWPA